MSANVIPEGILVGRASVPGHTEPRVVTVRNGRLIDITAKGFATVRDIAESGKAAAHVNSAEGKDLGDVEAIVANSVAG
ncbi:MAG: fumarylacetoacetate hydrolase, partial [Hyphomicrobiales bacterium]